MISSGETIGVFVRRADDSHINFNVSITGLLEPLRASITFPSGQGESASLPGMSIQFFVDAGADKSYTLNEYAGFSYTLQDAIYKTASGTATIAVKKNGTALTGWEALSATSTQTGPTAATGTGSDNEIVLGDKIEITVSAGTTAVDLSIILNGVKT